MNPSPYLIGFVNRALEYGLTEKQAVELAETVFSVLTEKKAKDQNPGFFSAESLLPLLSGAGLGSLPLAYSSPLSNYFMKLLGKKNQEQVAKWLGKIPGGANLGPFAKKNLELLAKGLKQIPGGAGTLFAIPASLLGYMGGQQLMQALRERSIK